MTTKNPRLTITLQPALSAQFRRLSELTGQSQSSIISELLSGSEPVLERMIRVLEAAEAAKGAIKGRVARGLDDAQAKLEGALDIALTGFDVMEQAFDEIAEKAPKAAPAAGKRSAAAGAIAAPKKVASTPLSNRGVRNSSRPLKNKEKTSTYATPDLEKVTGVKTPKKTVSKRAKKEAKDGEV